MRNTSSFDRFQHRHIGPNQREEQLMLRQMGLEDLDRLIDRTVPAPIRLQNKLSLPPPQTESEYLRELSVVADQNKVFRSFIGLGYYGTFTPSVILRNIFQNPGWYTQYTPYQAEIAQGRLEAILNFQTMVSDMTGLPIANASLLDEATAAAEAMAMFHGVRNKRTRQPLSNTFLVDHGVLDQTVDVLLTRAAPLGIEIVRGDWRDFRLEPHVFGVLLQYPNQLGSVEDYRAFVEKAHANEVYVTVATDLLALSLLKPPGDWGADCAVGNAQRFGVPMGFGGPHAAFFATRDDFKRILPGRIIGVSVDAHGKHALRMALQTREQHIRREKATSNICTAQALLAIMAGMYAVWHGPEGIRTIGNRVHSFAKSLDRYLREMGYVPSNIHFFDTLHIPLPPPLVETIRHLAQTHEINCWYGDGFVRVALDETVTEKDIDLLVNVFAQAKKLQPPKDLSFHDHPQLPTPFIRNTPFLTHPVFNSFHTETNMMRYIKRLEKKDLSLTHAMIPLGSCTMKLNAATELMPVSWDAFANIHPFAPADQTQGYRKIFRELEQYLCEITGFSACSLQPNSGAQGEYTGLLVIRAWHHARGEHHRNIALIPSSAHGTNPASAAMAGMQIVVVRCDERGNVDVEDLQAKCALHKDQLACLMVTYPSTHGVFETAIQDICQLIHDHGGLVYMDGANMNAQVGLTSPGIIGADVCHLNLHKTFAIPHGGGGPGMGPICVNDKLAPFLPGHPLATTGGQDAIHAVSAAPWGSASILLISYGYIRMLGAQGLTDATRFAILNANYIKYRLENSFPVLYTGENGYAAHELIIDMRPFKDFCSAEDVAKRLIDYGFHAPTLSFPVAGTLMIEPTESESMEELDRFCDALLQIRQEIDEIASGDFPADNNVLHNAPHTMDVLTADEWPFPYTREKAAWPLPYLRQGHKFWPSVARVDNAYGDRNLVCTCLPMEAYMEA
jgi:glycine dehydrogenase